MNVSSGCGTWVSTGTTLPSPIPLVKRPHGKMGDEGVDRSIIMDHRGRGIGI